MLRIGHAILHVFDFESGSTFFSERELDLDNRQTRSYVTRRLRRIRSSAESKHGTFAPESNFASGLKEYLAGQVPFVDFSVQIAQWFWEELRRAEDLEQCDLPRGGLHGHRRDARLRERRRGQGRRRL
jgi:nucleoid-associated protein YejK